LEGYYIAIPKPKRNAIPSLGYTINTMDELFWSRLLEGYYSCPKIFMQYPSQGIPEIHWVP
jgi:hypothetical protein